MLQKSTANKGKLCHIDIFYLLVRFYSVQRDNLYKINLDIQHYINKENHIYNIKWSHIQVTYKRTLLLSYSLEIMLKLGGFKRAANRMQNQKTIFKIISCNHESFFSIQHMVLKRSLSNISSSKQDIFFLQLNEKIMWWMSVSPGREGTCLTWSFKNVHLFASKQIQYPYIQSQPRVAKPVLVLGIWCWAWRFTPVSLSIRLVCLFGCQNSHPRTLNPQEHDMEEIKIRTTKNQERSKKVQTAAVISKKWMRILKKSNKNKLTTKKQSNQAGKLD